MKTNSHWEFLPNFGETVIKEERNDGNGNSRSGTAFSCCSGVEKWCSVPIKRKEMTQITIQTMDETITQQCDYV